MAQILSSSGQMKPLNLPKIGQFFRRRIQRIVPIYLILVYFSLHVGSILLSSQDFEQMCKDGFFAIIFGSNMQTIMHREVYMEQVKFYYILWWMKKFFYGINATIYTHCNSYLNK